MTNSAFMVSMQNVLASYGTTTVFRDISLDIRHNERWAVIGRNGVGKSTLIKIIAGLLSPEKGAVLINGIPVKKYPSRKRAQVVAYMPQKVEGIIPYSVHDFVMLGRYSTMGLLGVPSSKDREAVMQAIDICDIRDIVERQMNTLSGGELQRVMLAGAVAQSTPLLLLDEPTTFLDPGHERSFFAALERLRDKRELTLVMVTHDVNTAMVQCTHIAALLDGRLYYAGPSQQFASRCPEILEEIFSVRFEKYTCSSGHTDVFGVWGGGVCH